MRQANDSDSAGFNVSTNTV